MGLLAGESSAWVVVAEARRLAALVGLAERDGCGVGSALGALVRVPGLLGGFLGGFLGGLLPVVAPGLAFAVELPGRQRPDRWLGLQCRDPGTGLAQLGGQAGDLLFGFGQQPVWVVDVAEAPVGGEPV